MTAESIILMDGALFMLIFRGAVGLVNILTNRLVDANI